MSIFDIFKKKKGSKELETVVSSLTKNAIVIEVEDGEGIAPDVSKLGGKPYLPKDFSWPRFLDEDDERPLSFLCQINLSDVKQYDQDGLLPRNGLLHFFYDCAAFRWGFDPEDKGCARVFYFENTDGFAPMAWPEGIEEDYIVPEMPVRFSNRKSYPRFEELEIYSNMDCDFEDYDEVLEKLGVDLDAEDHKLLGYADIIQNEMLTECERASRGLYSGDPESYQNTPEDEEIAIAKSAKDWMLLLQLSTLEKDGWELMWGDCGMLYFYIKKQDLAQKRFENAWFSLQCG